MRPRGSTAITEVVRYQIDVQCLPLFMRDLKPGVVAEAAEYPVGFRRSNQAGPEYSLPLKIEADL